MIKSIIRDSTDVFVCIQGKINQFDIRDIIYVESYYRHLGIQMKEQRLEISGKIADARKALNPNIFYLCHQGFLVNMNYITKIEQKELICTPDFRVPISSRRRSDFMKAYSEFLGK